MADVILWRKEHIFWFSEALDLVLFAAFAIALWAFIEYCSCGHYLVFMWICVESLNECQENLAICGANAKCTDFNYDLYSTSGQPYGCSCLDGFEGDGLICTGMDFLLFYLKTFCPLYCFHSVGCTHGVFFGVFEKILNSYFGQIKFCTRFLLQTWMSAIWQAHLILALTLHTQCVLT